MHPRLNVSKVPIFIPDNPKETAPEISQLKGLVYALSIPGNRNILNIRKKIETGRITVSLDIIKRTIQESPSFRGRSIEFPHELLDENDVIKKLLIYAIDHPFLALRNVFFPHPKYWFRGFEDFLQLANIPFSAGTGLFEILFKMAGAAITPYITPYWRHIISKKQKPLTTRFYWAGLLLLTLPLWPVGQSLFFIGNACGYSRRIVDASCNVISSTLAVLFDLVRENKRYEIFYPPIFPSIRILIKNELLFIPAELILATSLLPAGKVAPFIVANSPELAQALLPLAKTLAPITTPMVDIVNSIFTSLNAGENIFTASILSSCTATISQLYSSGINTLVIKAKHHPLWRKIVGFVPEESVTIPSINSPRSTKSSDDGYDHYRQHYSDRSSQRSSTTEMTQFFADHPPSPLNPDRESKRNSVIELSGIQEISPELSTRQIELPPLPPLPSPSPKKEEMNAIEFLSPSPHSLKEEETNTQEGEIVPSPPPLSEGEVSNVSLSP